MNDCRVKLYLECPVCKRSSSEYSWTLKTAARFSIGEDLMPALIHVLMAELAGNNDDYEGYRIICPRCNEGSDWGDLAKPDPGQVRAYAAQCDPDYLEDWI